MCIWGIVGPLQCAVVVPAVKRNLNMTRVALMVALTALLATQMPVALSAEGFGDVPSDHWARQPIEWATSNGIVPPIDDRRFNPDGTVSRAHMVSFLHRLALRHSPPERPDPMDRGLTFVASPSGGNALITTVRPNGQYPTSIGLDFARVEDAVSSPDGTRGVYAGYQGDYPNIWGMDADGSGKEMLTDNSADSSHPNWSPDGTKIAYTTVYENTYRVWVMNTDGTDQTWLSDADRNTELSAQGWTSRALMPALGSGSFNDVPVGHYSDKPSGWAAVKGITKGVGNGRFDPEGTVTRGQMAAFLYRLYNVLSD